MTWRRFLLLHNVVMLCLVTCFPIKCDHSHFYEVVSLSVLIGMVVASLLDFLQEATAERLK
jgi:hypothetical protein